MPDGKWFLIENMVTLTATTSLTAALWWGGAGYYCFWAFVFLLNLNSCSQVRPKKEP